MKNKTNKFNYSLSKTKGWLDSYDKGGHLPIIVNDKNDPRLKAYNDSLYIYNKGEKQLNEFRLDHKEQIENFNKTKPFYKPTVYRKEQTDKATFVDEDTRYKGIDPIAYTFSQNPPVDESLIKIWGEDPNLGKFDKGFSFMPRYKKPSQQIIYQPKEEKITKQTKPIIIKKSGIKQLTPITNIQIPLDNQTPELKTVTNNQSKQNSLKDVRTYTNKKGGYINEGKMQGRQEFKYGGWLDKLN